MADGLTDAQRRRMERERVRAERRMAEERDRIQPLLEVERQHLAEARADELLEASHRQRFGPKFVTGPDGVSVRLQVRTSGPANWSEAPPSLRGPYGTTSYVRWQIYPQVVFGRPGFELRINAPGLSHRARRFFAPDEETAARLLLGAQLEVQEGGLPALVAWAGRRRAERR